MKITEYTKCIESKDLSCLLGSIIECLLKWQTKGGKVQYS